MTTTAEERTLTVADLPVGTRVRVAANATMSNGGRVFWGQEIIGTVRRSPAGPYYPNDVAVRRDEDSGNPDTSSEQMVAARCCELLDAQVETTQSMPDPRWTNITSVGDRVAVLRDHVPLTPWSQNRHRLCPERVTRVRAFDRTPENPHNVIEEAWLLQVDTTDNTLTFLVVSETADGMGQVFDPGYLTMTPIPYEPGKQYQTNWRKFIVPLPDEPSQTVNVEELDVPPEEVVRLIREGSHTEDVSEADAAEIEALVASVGIARTERDGARQERAQWIDNAITVSRRHARGADWCGVYDRTMVALGLPGRNDSFDGPDEDDEPETEMVTVTQDVKVSCTWVMEDADDYFVEQFGAPRDFVEYESSMDEVEMSVTIRLSTEVEVTEGNCGCGNVDDWADHLPAWVTSNHLSWTTDGDEECSND